MKYSLLVSIVFLVLTGACKQKDSDSSAIGAEYIFSEAYQNQWKGSPDHWRWENGILTGETTETNPIKRSAFLIWNREVEDFILNISFRISFNGNSGIYYRCEQGPEGYDDLLGYQADIDGQHTYTGIVYENFINRHRKILAERGRMVRISEMDSLHSFPIFTGDQTIKDYIKDNTWNAYELIVKGTLIVQKLNGQMVSMVEDNAKNRVKKGLFGFQLHQGPPMKVEFRDAWFRDLNPLFEDKAH
ncbi:DUF1080 domain-containing protein [Agriterribacter sp.]|uniref:3-keto-disaccharide hydrolase n=1 Tax=Agriterribacter sp. TaxID=2821509 RepID=UPI002B54199F|nr:DUF1080 domain-containing protein [Agriterribacter sp.]HRO44760.1 DUF1080 domain-containing protein [Agriterribacter sp.]HRQ16433.1 DUF1080 domain-containing protein [Agriterribacter sp.]